MDMNSYDTAVTADRMDPKRNEHRQRSVYSQVARLFPNNSITLIFISVMAFMLQARPTKRVKVSLPANDNTYLDDEVSCSSTLGGIEDQQSDNDSNSDDEDDPVTCQREEALLDEVLAIYDECEEDALVEQNRLRCKLTTCSMSKAAALTTQLSDAKIKCSLLKVLALLLQSDSSRLKGRLHADRMELMRQVQHVFLNNDCYSVDTLKRKFVMLFASLRRDLFPPTTIAIPSPIPTLSKTPGVSSDALDQESLNLETRHAMTCLDGLANQHLQQRLANGDFKCSITPSRVSDEEGDQDWEGMREVWNVWLQFPAHCKQQCDIWKETLASNEKLSSLLWNLAYYLSMDETSNPESYG